MSQLPKPSTNEAVRISVPRAGEVLGLSPSAAYRAAERGEIPGCLRLGRRLVVITPAFLKAVGLEELPPSKAATEEAAAA